MARQQQRSEETHARIINTAFTCFARDGYTATRVAEICREAGVSKGAFYHHFPSKQAVFLELMKSWLAEIDQQIQTQLGSSLPVPERFQVLANLVDRVFTDAQGSLPIFLEYFSQAARDDYIWQETVAPYQHFTTLIAGVFQEGIEEGSLRQIDPQVAARAIVSMAVGILVQGLVSSPGVDWGQVARDSVTMFIDGLRA